MNYVIVFCLVFFMIGMRAFQQKVITTNHYPGMGFVGFLIYLGEGSAFLLLVKGGFTYVVVGAMGAGCGVMFAVYMFNRFFTKIFIKQGEKTS